MVSPVFDHSMYSVIVFNVASKIWRQNEVVVKYLSAGAPLPALHTSFVSVK